MKFIRHVNGLINLERVIFMDCNNVIDIYSETPSILFNFTNALEEERVAINFISNINRDKAFENILSFLLTEEIILIIPQDL